MRALVVLLLACSPRIVRVPVSTVQDVRIVSVHDRAQCYLDEPPTPPDLLTSDYDNEDILRRVFVHFLEANQIIQHQHDVVLWMGEARSCIYQITGQEP